LLFEFYHFVSQLCYFAVDYADAQHPAPQKSQADCRFSYFNFVSQITICCANLTTAHAQKAG